MRILLQKFDYHPTTPKGGCSWCPAADGVPLVLGTSERIHLQFVRIVWVSEVRCFARLHRVDLGPCEHRRCAPTKRESDRGTARTRDVLPVLLTLPSQKPLKFDPCPRNQGQHGSRSEQGRDPCELNPLRKMSQVPRGDATHGYDEPKRIPSGWIGVHIIRSSKGSIKVLLPVVFPLFLCPPRRKAPLWKGRTTLLWLEVRCRRTSNCGRVAFG